MNTKKAVISGGTGMVGKQLCSLLISKGYHITVLTRSESLTTNKQGITYAFWDPGKNQLDANLLEGADLVINLAGAGVADQKWSSARKKEIYDSRISATRTLVNGMNECRTKPVCFLSASAIGIYGDGENRLLTEESEPARGFLAKVCVDWEKEALKAKASGIRTCCFRIGIVLSRNGGALKEMTKTIPLGIAGYFNKTPLWTSWIHEADLCEMFWYAAGHENVSGIFNAVAPHPEEHKTLIEELRKNIQPKAIMVPAPAFGLKLAMGEMAGMLLSSQKCSAQKIMKQGFKFRFEHLSDALKDLYKK